MFGCLGSGPPSSATNSLNSSLYVSAIPMRFLGRRTKEDKENSKSQKSKRASRRNQSASSPPVSGNEPNMTLNQILLHAGKRGLGGGIPGAIAGVVQTLSLMWLRTIINYQLRYGTTFRQAVVTLSHDGGIRRFYRGLSFALVQAPTARFVSTAANDGVEALLASLPLTRDWGPGRTTVVASIVVGAFRMMLMPIDTCKTVLQVDSVEGFRSLMRRVRQGKIGLLYQGAFAYAISAILGHYPWFFTYNVLSKNEKLDALIRPRLLRNAFTGFVASLVSDTVVNAMRVIKTTKQAIGAKHTVTYMEAINMVLAADGWQGLLGRGLKTRLFANAIQSVVFTVIWRGLSEQRNQPSSESKRLLRSDESRDQADAEDIYEEEAFT